VCKCVLYIFHMRKTVETSKEKRYFQEPAGETVLTHRARFGAESR